MTYQRKIHLTILSLFVTVACAAQVEAIKGIVADSANHRPIANVNVTVKHLQRGTTTDSKGYFSLPARSSDTLVFSYVGYRTMEFTLVDWEPSVILMTEEIRVLNTVTIEGAAIGNRYEELFAEENIRLKNSKKSIPFYYPRDKKEKIKIARAKKESVRVQHYVNLLVKDDKVKNDLMKKYRLSEDQYYTILTRFNERNYAIMYYLTDSELLTLLYRFFENETSN